jgi:hypothetical protein
VGGPWEEVWTDQNKISLNLYTLHPKAPKLFGAVESLVRSRAVQ